MAQHFLLSPVAASLPDDSLQHLLSHNEPLAYALFMLYRWGSLIEQICPRCGVIDRHLPRVKHEQWRCTGCRHDFSLKSGSLLDNTKLPYWKVLTALLIWMSQPKGLTAITVKNRCELSYESAYILHCPWRFGPVPTFKIKPRLLWRASAMATLDAKSSASRRSLKSSARLSTMYLITSPVVSISPAASRRHSRQSRATSPRTSVDATFGRRTLLATGTGGSCASGSSRRMR